MIQMLKRILGPILALALMAGACGSADTATDTATDGSDTGAAATQTDDSNDASPSDDETFSGDGSREFCEVARDFSENNPFENAGIPDEEFFNTAEALWSDVLDIAPSEIKDDFETTLSSFQEFEGIMEKYDYDFFDEALRAELGALDSSASNAAGARISAYLEDVCGVVGGFEPDDGGGVPVPEGLDPGGFGALGIDAETAECLSEQLGDQFDLESPDMSILTEPVCGTTLMEIITNMG